MILIDTGPIVALFDKDDNYHQRCVDILKKIKEPLITTWPVLTEAFYLLNFSWHVQNDLWEFIQRGGVQIKPLKESLYSRLKDLMKKYYDLPMDLADATIVATGEDMNIITVFTLDHKDFRLYKPKHRKRFALLPSVL